MLHQIGIGVLGPVFRTYEPQRDRLIAVKVFRLDITPEQARSLADELQKVVELGLHHPAIVTPVAAGVEGTSAYLAEEYVAAESLDVAMRHYAPAPVEKALPFLIQLAGAVDFARGVGVSHGALHPRDVFMTPDQARATGFGVAAALERVGIRPPVRRPYSAPERIDGGRWGTEADVFALAAIAFELFTGRRIAGAANQFVPSLGEQRAGPEVSALQDVLAMALSDHPARRFGSALAFTDALQAAITAQTVGAPARVSRTAKAGRRDEGPIAAAGVETPASVAAPQDGADEPPGKVLRVPKSEPAADVALRSGLAELSAAPAGEALLVERDGRGDSKPGRRARGRELEPAAAPTAEPERATVPRSSKPTPRPRRSGTRTPSRTDVRAVASPSSGARSLEEAPPLWSDEAAKEPDDDAGAGARGVTDLASFPAANVAREDEAEVDGVELGAPVVEAETPRPHGSRASGRARRATELSRTAEQAGSPHLQKAAPFAAREGEGAAERSEASGIDREADLLTRGTREVVMASPVEAIHSEWESDAGIQATTVAGAGSGQPYTADRGEAPRRSAPLPPIDVAAEAARVTYSSRMLMPVAAALAIGLSIGFAAGYGMKQVDAPPGTLGSTGGEFTEQQLAEVPTAEPAEVAPSTGASPPPAAVPPVPREEPVSRTDPSPTEREAPRSGGAGVQAGALVGRILIRSTPAGAEVSVDGRPRGVTPLVVRDLPYGSYTISVNRPGHREESRRVAVSAARPSVSTTFELVPRALGSRSAESVAGSLYVDSRPRGARLFLDGSLVGTTPSLVPSLRPGTHQVRIERDGYRPWSAGVDVKTSERSRVTASLERQP